MSSLYKYFYSQLYIQDVDFTESGKFYKLTEYSNCNLAYNIKSYCLMKTSNSYNKFSWYLINIIYMFSQKKTN